MTHVIELEVAYTYALHRFVSKANAGHDKMPLASSVTQSDIMSLVICPGSKLFVREIMSRFLTEPVFGTERQFDWYVFGR